MPSNWETGDAFHRLAQAALETALSTQFDINVPLPIGNPPPDHKFDFATADRRIVGECKAYAWTASGNAPSAKISNLKEAIQFLHALPAGTKTFIIMKRHCKLGRGEALADYFARLTPSTHCRSASRSSR